MSRLRLLLPRNFSIHRVVTTQKHCCSQVQGLVPTFIVVALKVSLYRASLQQENIVYLCRWAVVHVGLCQSAGADVRALLALSQRFPTLRSTHTSSGISTKVMSLTLTETSDHIICRIGSIPLSMSCSARTALPTCTGRCEGIAGTTTKVLCSEEYTYCLRHKLNMRKCWGCSVSGSTLLGLKELLSELLRELLRELPREPLRVLLRVCNSFLSQLAPLCCNSCVPRQPFKVISWYNNCFSHQKNCYYIRLSLLRSTIAVRMKCLIPTSMIDTSKYHCIESC